MNLGKQLEYLIEERELTRKKVAEDLGIAASTLSSYITNHRQPDLDMMVRIADYFGTSVDFMLEHIPSKSVNKSTAIYQQRLMHLSQDFSVDQMELLNRMATSISLYQIEKGKK